MSFKRSGNHRTGAATPESAVHASGSLAGGLAGGLAAGLLANAVGGRKMRKFAGAAAKLGGAAAIGGLAWRAYNRYRAGGPVGYDVGGEAVPVSWQNLTERQFIPTELASVDARELLILRAIVAAANADGFIDGRGRLLILARIEAMNLSGRDKAFLADEIESPMSYEELASFALTPALAAAIFTASLIPLDTSSLESRAYLGALAQSMALPRALVLELNRNAQLLAAAPARVAVA